MEPLKERLGEFLPKPVIARHIVETAEISGKKEEVTEEPSIESSISDVTFDLEEGQSVSSAGFPDDSETHDIV